jgi:hypothetical protein
MSPFASPASAAPLLAALALAVLPLTSGCAVDPRPIDAPSAGGNAQTAFYSFAFSAAGISASSGAERRATAQGGEVLHGTTEVGLPGGAHPLTLAETAELDAAGRLVLATSELRRGVGGGELVRSVRLDAARGLVTIRSANGEVSWPEATDSPWIYERAFASAAPEMASATPVQAWIARRAAQAGARLRAIDVDDRSSRLTIASQVVLDDGASKWVVLGEEAIEVSPEFVRDMPWSSLRAAASARASADPCHVSLTQAR